MHWFVTVSAIAYEVEGKGALAERMIRRSWKIARIANTPDDQGHGQNIPTTYSHKEGLPKKEETVPTLKNSDGHIIHKHYSGDWANQRWGYWSLYSKK